MDTITEVVKFNAAQQLTMTIIPSSMINMMSSGEDQCFQWQEPGHIAWHCPHIRCHECDEYGHIVMDIPHRIPPSGTQAPHHKAHKNSYTRSSYRHHWETEKEETSPDHSLDTADTIAPAIMTCIEAAPDHNNRTGSATIEAAQDDPIQHTEDTVIGPTMTHHTRHTTNPQHTTAHQATTLRTSADLIHAHPTDHWSILHTKEDHAVQDHTVIREPKNYTLEGISRSR